jgi:hypothetical protein
MWFAYIHCWATDVFSMDPSRDYVSSTGQTLIRENENGARPRQLRKKGSAEDCLRVIVKKVSINPIIQSKTRYY